MRATLAARPKPWGLLHGLCRGVGRFSAAARKEPTGPPAATRQSADLCAGRCAMSAGVGLSAGSRTQTVVFNVKEEAKQMGFNVISGQKRGMGVVSGNDVAVVREGTTGRLVATLPRVWAVAAGTAERSATPARKKEAGTEALPKLELGFYRKYKEALLRRYMQMTMESGRVPSMMGREVLGGKASSYRIHGFDDAVNFRLDVEKCLKQLEPAERDVVRRVAMQEYTQGEAAVLLGICLRTCVQRYGRAMDRLTGILLETRLLEPFKGLSRGRS